MVGVNAKFNERCDVLELDECILWNDYIITEFFTFNILSDFYYISCDQFIDASESSDEDELVTKANVVQIDTNHNSS